MDHLRGRNSAALGAFSELRISHLAQQVAALHLALAGLRDDLHDLSPVLVPGLSPLAWSCRRP